MPYLPLARLAMQPFSPLYQESNLVSPRSHENDARMQRELYGCRQRIPKNCSLEQSKELTRMYTKWRRVHA